MPILTVTEAANKSRATLYRHIKKGELADAKNEKSRLLGLLEQKLLVEEQIKRQRKGKKKG